GGEDGGSHDLPRGEMQHEHWLRRISGGGIRIRGVVVDAKLGQVRQQLHEVQPAVPPAPPDAGFRDVVTAGTHAVADTFDVQIRAGQSDVPDAYLEAL